MICYHCGSALDVETHHWAPKDFFNDPDSWPTSPLCGECHKHWHSVINARRGDIPLPTEGDRFSHVLDIVRKVRPRSHNEIKEELKKRGINVTQPTIQRDVQQLGLVKRGGRYCLR